MWTYESLPPSALCVVCVIPSRVSLKCSKLEFLFEVFTNLGIALYKWNENPFRFVASILSKKIFKKYFHLSLKTRRNFSQKHSPWKIHIIHIIKKICLQFSNTNLYYSRNIVNWTEEQQLMWVSTEASWRRQPRILATIMRKRLWSLNRTFQVRTDQNMFIE